MTLGPVTWGLGATSYWWPNVPYVQGYRAKLHVAARDRDSGRSRRRRGCRALPSRFASESASSRQVTAHYELNGVPIKFRGDNVQGADYDSIKTAGEGQLGRLRPVSRVLAAVGQQSGLAAGRG